MGAVGSLAAHVYNVLVGIEESRGFWDTAKYLLATYGAYEAYRIVRFNLTAHRLGAGKIDLVAPNYERLRPNSRLLLGSGYWSQGARFPGFSLSGVEELRPLLVVMAAALLAERLKLRQHLNNAPLQALGLYAFVSERSL
jgi:hypothetical protein